MSLEGSAKSHIELKGSMSLPKAIQGKSAYEIALLNGFKGTEAEWLESLIGESVYDYAVELGYKGTEEEYKAACEAQRVLSIVQASVNLSAKIVDDVLVVSDGEGANYANYVRLADTETGKAYYLSISNGKLVLSGSEGEDETNT